jgi:carbonic anhydrase
MQKYHYIAVLILVLFSILAVPVAAQEEGIGTVYVDGGVRLRSSPVYVDSSIARTTTAGGEEFPFLTMVEGELISQGTVTTNKWYQIADTDGTELYVWSGVARVELADAPEEHDADVVHWGYEDEEGPEHWGDLSHDFEACSNGSAQSPIDITGAAEVSLNDLEFSYEESQLLIFNNGHTIEVEYHSGSSITYNETTYQLLQFHFHRPSEHTINGEPADMEMHLVHLSESGRLAVVGALMNAGDEHNEDFEIVFNHLPAEVGEADEDTEIMINAEHLLPESRMFYTYEGSLTTPPCTEGVRWLVMQEPLVLSMDQVIDFAAIFRNNARPTQPLNTRDLLADRD